MVRPRAARVNLERAMTVNHDPKWWRNPWRLLSLAMGFLGLGGIPGNIQGWGMYVGFIAKMLDHQLARWMLVFLAVGIFLYADRFPHVPWVKLLGIKPAPPPAAPRAVESAYKGTGRGGLMVFRQMVRAGTQHSEVPNDRLPPLKCEPCKGSGKSWGRYERKCGLCEGTGELPGEYAQFPTCIQCGGNGLSHGRYEHFCDTCGGVGRRSPQ